MIFLPDAWRSRIACAAVLVLGLWTAGAAAEESPHPKVPDAEKLRWLTEHAVAVRPAVPPEPAEDFSDLMPLVKSIGSSRVVALGEATHGDGAALVAKGRLVRFLHQVMGFDVLAWESGFFDVRLMDAALRGDVPLQEAASRGLYQIWWKSVEVQPVFAYVRATQATIHPLQTVGFDCRVSREESRSKLYPAFVFEFFDRLDPALISKQERADLTAMSVGLLPTDVYDHPGERIYNRDLPRRLISVIDSRRADFLVRSSPREIDDVRQSLVSFLSMDRSLGGRAGTGHDEEGYTRDTAMAENLLWLLQGPLAGRKVIVWAHNYHVMRDFTSAGVAATEAAKTHPSAGAMGLHLARALGRDFYVIGFITHHGRFGYAGEAPEDFPTADPASLEGLLHAVGKPQLFLSLRDLPPDHWLGSPISSGFYFHEPQTTNMPRIYDAVFFIDEMTPSHTVEPVKPL
jgi:erythromycin esterase